MSYFKWATYLVVLPFVMWASTNGVFAQTSEVFPGDCFNGIDDDLDGLVDCYDPECVDAVECDSFYFGDPNPPCAFVPSPIGFGAQEDWQTDTIHKVSPFCSPIAGDIDNDEVPEVIAQGVSANGVLPSSNIHVFSGSTGLWELALDLSTVTPIPGTVCRFHASTAAVAELDMVDARPEIVVMSNERILTCFNHDGTILWATFPGVVGYPPGSSWSYPIPGIADFNQDGFPEVYCGNQIFSGQTGVKIAERGAFGSQGKPGRETYSVSAAVDVLPAAACPTCSGLELVCGDTVYAIDLAGGPLPANRITPAQGRPAGQFYDGFTSIADYTMDGNLDAIICATIDSTTTGRLWVWDITTNTVVGYNDVAGNPGSGCIGQATCGDFDNDGLPEIGLAGFNLYEVFDDHLAVTPPNLASLWQNTSTDASGYTGSSVFDFNGDFASEVVYRAQDNLYIYDGATGAVLQSLPCFSLTIIEHPVVLDVDGEEQTEVVCSCGDSLFDKTGHINAFRSQNVPWIPSRKVWNQSSYFNVNINDDLSIPPFQQNHSPWVRLNAYLKQSTFLDTAGLPTYPAPDAELVDLTVDLSDCGDVSDPTDSICITMSITNISSSLLLERHIPVSLYYGDPYTDAGAIFIDSTETLIKLDSSDTITVSECFEDPGGSFTVYTVVNDDGASTPPFLPTPGKPSTGVGECDYLNNVASANINNCVLPVELLAFDGVLIDRMGHLSWKTATENNSDKFLLQRRKAGEIYWDDLQEVPAAGNSSSLRTYGAVDDLTFADVNEFHYRLKQIDLDGTYAYSREIVILRLDDPSQTGLIAVYPVPTQNSITVDFILDAPSNVIFQVYDITGTLARSYYVERLSGRFKEQLDLSDLSNGVYMLKATANGKTSVKKIILDK